jgi:hypothetical protein
MNPPQSSRQSRIPFTLQAVFLASNRGNEVHKPPPEKVASKVFFRNWLFQRQSNSANKRNSLFSLSKQDVKQEEKAVVERRSSSGSGNVSCSNSLKENLVSHSTLTSQWPLASANGPTGVFGCYATIERLFNEAIRKFKDFLSQQADCPSIGIVRCLFDRFSEKT